MTDTVSSIAVRLRKRTSGNVFSTIDREIMTEAADEIERLHRAGYGGLHYDLAEAQRQEIDRLRRRNAALVEIVQYSPCPYDRRFTVISCQQCGCSRGLMIRPIDAKADGERDD